MKPFTTHLLEVSEWIVNLRYEDLPDAVIEAALAQQRDVVAAICAGHRCTAGRKLKRAMEHSATSGPCTILPTGEKWAIQDAIYYHAALINALEMDNISVMGHLSQSTVSVTWAVSEMFDVDIKKTILAQVIGTELSGRMGVYMITGPQQGHMRAFLHRLSGAVCTGVLLGFDVETLAQAMAMALSTPEFPLYPAAFSPDSKVICTSAPSVEGFRAAMMAKEGLQAAVDILEHPVGFWEYFSYMDHVPNLWEHMGKTWSMYSLSFKHQGSCGYAQSAVAASLAIRKMEDFQLEEVEKVEVGLSLLSVVMEAFSKPHYGASLTPVNTHFSIRRSVSAAFQYGDLDGNFWEDGNFDRVKDSVASWSEKVSLYHDWQLTIDLAKGFDMGLEGAGKPGVLGMGNADRTLKIMQKAFGSPKLFSLKDLPALYRLKGKDRRYFFRRYWTGYRARLPFWGGEAARRRYRSHEKDLDKMELRLGSKVKVSLKNGKVLENLCAVPPGFAGDPHKMEAAREKYYRETVPIYGKEKAEKIDQLIYTFPDGDIKSLMSAATQ